MSNLYRLSVRRLWLGPSPKSQTWSPSIYALPPLIACLRQRRLICHCRLLTRPSDGLAWLNTPEPGGAQSTQGPMLLSKQATVHDQCLRRQHRRGVGGEKQTGADNIVRQHHPGDGLA